MKIVYLADARLPTEKAHGLEIMKLCEALANFAPVKLIIPRRFNKIKADPFDYYQVAKKFTITKLPLIDALGLKFPGKIGFWIGAVTFSLSSVIYLLFNTDKNDFIISHSNAPLLVAALIKKKCFYDVHDFPVNGLFFYKLLLKNCAGLITTNNWKKEKLIEQFGIRPENILVFPNGVEIKEFDIATTQTAARQRLNLPLDKKLLIYTGHLFSWKGVDTLAAASQFIPSDCLIYFVGGTDKDIQNFQKKYSQFKNIVIVGQKPHQEIPLWLKAADLLIIPNTAKEDISKYFTSPMKLFEHMASQSPIIASDIPSIRQIVNDQLVTFFEPDNSRHLAKIIDATLKDYSTAQAKALLARQEVQKYTWLGRAKKIYDQFIA